MLSEPTQLDLDTFQPLHLRAFTLHFGTQGFHLVLREVVPLAASNGPRGMRAPFQLQFHCEGFQYPPQGTYRLTADNGFDHLIFLVPVGQDDTGILLHAVFN